MSKYVFFEPHLNFWRLKQPKKAYVLDYLKHKLCISRNYKSFEVDQVAKDLKHQVKAPNPIHAHRQEKHHYEWNCKGNKY